MLNKWETDDVNFFLDIFPSAINYTPEQLAAMAEDLTHYHFEDEDMNEIVKDLIKTARWAVRKNKTFMELILGR